jgi:predicted phosphohydrolase
MILQYCSDLHLEFPKNEAYIKANPIHPIGNILILAGDVTLFTRIDRQKEFFDYVSDHFAATYWIPGNHEYYQSDISSRSGSFEEKIRNNVSLVNNITINVDTHQLLFTTLWSSISLLNGWRIERGLNDFYQINYKGQRLQVPDYNDFHKDCIEFLCPALEIETPGKKVVITHHLPTFKNYPTEYKSDFLNEAFATILDDLILETTPDYWIYGHHHRNIPEFKIGHTKLLTNQLGYVQQNEHLHYRTDKCIEL